MKYIYPQLQTDKQKHGLSMQICISSPCWLMEDVAVFVQTPFGAFTYSSPMPYGYGHPLKDIGLGWPR